MSSTTTPKHEFLVIVKDAPDMQAKRLEVRPAHLEGMKPLAASGAFTMGGALLADVPTSSDPSTFKFLGSSVVMVAESKEQCLEILRNDPYAKAGVWDMENVQIYPFKTAFRTPNS